MYMYSVAPTAILPYIHPDVCRSHVKTMIPEHTRNTTVPLGTADRSGAANQIPHCRGPDQAVGDGNLFVSSIYFEYIQVLYSSINCIMAWIRN